MKLIRINGPLILLWISLTSVTPFIFYSWPGHPHKILTFICLTLISLFILKKKNIILDKGIFFVSIVLFFFFLVENYRATSNEGYTLSIQIVAFFITYLFVENIIGFKYFTKSYISIIILMGIGGTITFVIHFIWGLNPIFASEYGKEGLSYFYGLTCTNGFSEGSGSIIRYSGFFDEPGAYGLYAGFGLILNKLYFDNRKYELYLSILPLFTFSLAFFIFIAIYYIFFTLKKRNITVLLIFISFLGFSYFFIKSNQDSMLYAQTISRLETDNTTGIKGNSRFIQQNIDEKTFQENKLFGKGLSNVGGSNLYAILAKHGLIGFFFYYSLLIYFLIKFFSSSLSKIFCLKILVLLSLTFFHRPELTNLFGLLIIASMIFATSKKYLNLVILRN
jgi:hypothetical protein